MRTNSTRRWLVAALLTATPVAAQTRPVAPVRITIAEELPHVEVSAGVTTMGGGPGRDAEREMRILHLDDPAARFRKKTLPWTQPGIGLFGQVHLAVTPHAMIGYVVSLTQQDTHGARTAPDPTPGVLIQSSYVDAHQEVKTRAIVMSLRPNGWIKVGAGPAIHERTFEIGGPQSTAGSVADASLGWVANGELILHREPMTYDHPPFFVKVVGQYRAAGSATGNAAVVPLGKSYAGADLGNVQWPQMPLRFSHWMVGIGFGLEF